MSLGASSRSASTRPLSDPKPPRILFDELLREKPGERLPRVIDPQMRWAEPQLIDEQRGLSLEAATRDEERQHPSFALRQRRRPSNPMDSHSSTVPVAPVDPAERATIASQKRGCTVPLIGRIASSCTQTALRIRSARSPQNRLI